MPGYNQTGIKEKWYFLVHSTGIKGNPSRNNADSWGCQILGNDDFANLMNKLRGIGFKKGDTLGMSIK